MYCSMHIKLKHFECLHKRKCHINNREARILHCYIYKINIFDLNVLKHNTKALRLPSHLASTCISYIQYMYIATQCI